MTDVRITVLVENTASGPDLPGEHGLAFWIELGGKRILFDTGQGKVLAGNARRLGVRLETADAVVLSHGHYDHTRGLAQVLRAAGRTAVYVHPAAFEPKYARNPDGTGRSVGMPAADAGAARELGEIVGTEGPTDVGAGLRLTGAVPRTTDFEDTGGAFFTDADCTIGDELPDDQAAFVETAAGTLVILGCAHAGVINTLRYVQALTGGRPIDTVIGGMHLRSAAPERMDETAAALRRLDVQRLLPCHCTGAAAVARLRRELPGRCADCPVGTVLEWEG